MKMADTKMFKRLSVPKPSVADSDSAYCSLHFVGENNIDLTLVFKKMDNKNIFF